MRHRYGFSVTLEHQFHVGQSARHPINQSTSEPLSCRADLDCRGLSPVARISRVKRCEMRKFSSETAEIRRAVAIDWKRFSHCSTKRRQHSGGLQGLKACHGLNEIEDN